MKELESIVKLIEAFKKLPSVGTKSAERMAYATLNMDKEDVLAFEKALDDVVNKVHSCPICGLYTENDICEVCSDINRDDKTLIVVSYPKDAQAFEKVDSIKAKYHVLNGVLSASNGIGVEDLAIDSLISRITKGNIKEVIIATNPTIEGETTALYLAKVLEKYDVNVSRLAYGLPMGGHLDYADALTLDRAIEGRTSINKKKEED